MEDITDVDCLHSKRIRKDFEIKEFDEYHDFYLKGDRALLADVFENFRKMCLNLKIYHLNIVRFLSAPKAAFKKVEGWY